jgi:hypothetical protein
MQVRLLSEHGYEESALGFSLSYNTSIERAKELFPKYAFKQGGENKFLESMIIWVDVTAPRFWWQEADTYRISTKQSESTMHTLCKSELSEEDFEYPIGKDYLLKLNEYITLFKNDENFVPIEKIKNILPEGFLQRRIWLISYKTLQNMYNQRKSHRLPQWKIFLDKVLRGILYPEFICR